MHSLPPILPLSIPVRLSRFRPLTGLIALIVGFFVIPALRYEITLAHFRSECARPFSDSGLVVQDLLDQMGEPSAVWVEGLDFVPSQEGRFQGSPCYQVILVWPERHIAARLPVQPAGAQLSADMPVTLIHRFNTHNEQYVYRVFSASGYDLTPYSYHASVLDLWLHDYVEFYGDPHTGDAELLSPRRPWFTYPSWSNRSGDEQ